MCHIGTSIMVASNAESVSMPLPEKDYWNQIIGLTAMLPYVHIDKDERTCRENVPGGPPPENEGLLARRLREMREQQLGEQPCPGGSYIKLGFQAGERRRDSPLIVFAHEVLVRACEHTLEGEDDVNGDAFFDEVAVFRRFKRNRRHQHMQDFVGAKAVSWFDMSAGGSHPARDVVAKGLQLAGVIRLEHRRPNSNTVLTAHKTGAIEDLRRTHDILEAALSDMDMIPVWAYPEERAH